jgi:hypothetical protein
MATAAVVTPTRLTKLKTKSRIGLFGNAKSIRNNANKAVTQITTIPKKCKNDANICYLGIDM